MKFTLITLFPNLVEGFLQEGLLAQARQKQLVEIETLNPREFSEDVHQTVDDRAFGGGDGMVMKVEPLAKAVKSLGANVHVVVLSPQGRPWQQREAESWAQAQGHVALVCGRYAGIDHRFTVTYAADEISLGDFVLNGGEIAALAMVESVTRLLPGVLGNSISIKQDSFNEGLLECPQFTRPREVEGLAVPAPLLSGNHAEIEAFTHAVSLVRTALLRPDLLDSLPSMGKVVDRLSGLKADELIALGLTKENLDWVRQEWP